MHVYNVRDKCAARLLKTCHFLASFNILSFIFGFGNFVLFSSRLERKQFNRKTFKITMSTYFVL